MVSTLYIIGNGFDFGPHKLKTKYSDFKDYVLNMCNNYDSQFFEVPYEKTTYDGYEYDYDEVLSLIINIISDCAGDNWSDLEGVLGNDLIRFLCSDSSYFDTIDIDDKDKVIRHSMYRNEDNSASLCYVFSIFKELLISWVQNELKDIHLAAVDRVQFPTEIKDSVFFTFNYTKLLEELYNVPSDKVCHIHGSVDDAESKILFGHYDKDMGKYLPGSEFNLRRMLDCLRKDVDLAIRNHLDFYKNIYGVKNIYSYGSSLSKVDVKYISELCKYINPHNITWYFNKFDTDNNPDLIDLIKGFGFIVKSTPLW